MKKKDTKSIVLKIQSRPGGINFFCRWLTDFSPLTTRSIGDFLSVYNAKNKDEKKLYNEQVITLITTMIDNNMLFDDQVDLNEYFLLTDQSLNQEIELSRKIFNKLSVAFTSIIEYQGGIQQFLAWVYFTSAGNCYYVTKQYLDNMTDQNWVSHQIGIEQYKLKGNELFKLMSEYSTQVMEQNTIVFNADNIPEELLVSFQQYFLFFNEYIEAVKGEKVDLEVRKINDGLQFRFKADDSEKIEKVKGYLNEFFSLARRVIIAKEPIEEVLEQMKLNEIKKIQLEAQVNHLQLSLKLKETEVKYLTRENDFLKTLALNFTEHSQATITNQFISDGQQQFGTTIQNLKPPKKDQPEH